MARKKYHEEEPNHERWLVSYADFMTLLFAFFVVMYAISSLNEGKYRVLSDSIHGAFGKNLTPSGKIPNIPLAPAVVPVMIKPEPLPQIKPKAAEALHKERERMTSVAKNILLALEPLVREGKVRVSQTSRGVIIEIDASLLFAPGEAKLSEASNAALKEIVSVLRADNHAIQVEGFTDNLPIKNSIFPSNWELSAVRASSVVRLFVENGIADDRMSALGQGPKSPVDSNDTPEGRARNRRVTITILAILPEKSEDVPISIGQESTEKSKPVVLPQSAVQN